MKREKFDQIFKAANPVTVDRALYRMAKQIANSLALRWDRRRTVVDSEDLVQGVWVHLRKGQARYCAERGDPWAFFWAIGRREGQTMLGRRRRKFPVEDAAGALPDDAPLADAMAQRSDVLSAHRELEARLREDPDHAALITCMLDPASYHRGRPPRPLWNKIARTLGKPRAEVLATITAIRFKAFDLVHDERKFPCRSTSAIGPVATSSSPAPDPPIAPTTNNGQRPADAGIGTNAVTRLSPPSTAHGLGDGSAGPSSQGFLSANSARSGRPRTSTTPRKCRPLKGGAAA